MLHMLFLLSALITGFSQAANSTQNKFTLRKSCDSLASALCCPVLQCVINGSNYALYPTIPNHGANLHSFTFDHQNAAILALAFAPYVARFTNQRLLDNNCCNDPIETCCPGVRNGEYLPALRLACKGPAAAAALAIDLAILNYCPSFGAVYEFLPERLGCEDDGSIMCIGYEMLTAASCMGDCATEYCLECATETCCRKTTEKRD